MNKISRIFRSLVVAAWLVPIFGAVTLSFMPNPIVYAEGESPTQTTSEYEKTAVCKDKECFLSRYLKPVIRVLTALVGIGATISIVYAGIMYSSSGGDSAKLVKAKQRIFNTVVGVLLYVFLFAFLQWIVPGGI